VSAALPKVVVADVAAALGRAGRAWRADFRGPLVAVAGSNGKTTTKEMLAAILGQRGECLATRGNLNNRLGVPLTLLRLRDGHRSAVIEMGANHAGEVAELMSLARPDIGLITNAGAEHLEGFGIWTGWRAPRVRSSQGWAQKGWRSSTRTTPMRRCGAA